MKKVRTYTISDIEKILKPSLLTQICSTLILLGPYLNLLFMVVIKDYYADLVLTVLLTGLTLPILTLSWIWYLKLRKEYKSDAKTIYSEIEQTSHQEEVR